MCIVDGKTVFDYEEDYTIKCEACSNFCKLYKYRACQERQAWNLKNGIDVFSELKKLDSLAAYQTGIAPNPGDSTSNKPSKKTPSRHRGR